MKKLIYLFVFVLIGVSGFGQPPCGSNPAAGNTCATATPICELNGYCGNTSSSYTADAWGSAGAPLGCGFLGLSSCPGTGILGSFCGSVENDSYLSFVASSSSISFNCWVYNSSYGDGIQIMIFSGTCGGNITSYYCDQLVPSASSQTVSATGLTPGNTYYIMIDGFAGDVCDYTFAANTGISIPVDVTPLTSTICAGQSVTLTATGGNGTYTWAASPNLSATSGATVTATPPSTPGTYTYTVNSATGNALCPSATTATATIIVNSCGGCTVSAGNSGDVCQGTATFNLTATNVAGATWNWVGPNGFTSNVQNPASVPVPAAAGSYTYTVTATVAGTPCTSTTTIVVNPTPTINAPLTSLCVGGGTTTLTGTGTAHASTPWSSSNPGVATVSGAGVVTAVSAGTTTITYMNSGGCTTTQVVSVVASPTATIAGSTTICSGGSATISFTGTPNATVTYQAGGTNQTILLDATGNGSLSVSPTVTTIYSLVSVQINPPGGCSDTVTGSATVTVSPNPVANAVSAITVCANAAVLVPSFTSTPAGATFSWTNSNSTIGLAASGSGDIPSFTGLNPGSGSNTGTIAITPTLNGCVGTPITFTITVDSPPLVNAGSNVTMCVNAPGSYQIGQTPVSGVNYSWSPATGLNDATIANPTFDGTVAGVTNYTLTASIGACSSTDNVTVTIYALPAVNFSSDVTSGCNPQEITFTTTTSSANCVWNLEGYGTQTGCGSIIQNYTSDGMFDVSLTVIDLNGCVNTLIQTDMITIFPQPDAAFDVTPTVLSTYNPLVNTNNHSTNATNYSWDFGDGFTSNASSPNHTYPAMAGSYEITLYATNGICIDSAVATVEVIDELTWYIPNTFTPDGDEFNNVFLPIFNDAFDKQSYTLWVFDRWGEILFETHDTTVGWDGTYNGELCKEGAYTWKIVIKQKIKDYRIDLHGHINLLK